MRRASGGDDCIAFVGVHELCGIEQAGEIFSGDGEEPVFIGMDELARLDGLTEHLDGGTPADGACVGVSDAEPAGERFEAGVVHLIEIADGPVGDGADASESAVGIAIDLAPEGADDTRFVEILDDDDFGAWDGSDVTTVLAPGGGVGSRVVWV